MTKTDEKSAVSFEAHVARLPQNGLPVVIEADEAQRERLALDHGLLSVERYHVELLLSAWKRRGIRVSGTLEADITQACVVSLEPIRTQIETQVEGLFAPEGTKLTRPDANEGGEIMLDVEGPESPEPYSGDTIDVGAFAEQFFGLEIDPYPRKEGASLDIAEDEGALESEFQKKLRVLLAKSGNQARSQKR